MWYHATHAWSLSLLQHPQDYTADCDELQHPVIKDLTKLRMSTMRRFHPHLVKAHDAMCVRAASGVLTHCRHAAIARDSLYEPAGWLVLPLRK